MMKGPILVILLLNVAYSIEEPHSWEPRYSLPGQCGPLERYNECGSRCKIDCYSAQIVVPCKSDKCLQGCYCREGLLRSGKNAHCVKEADCPKFRKRSAKIAEREAELKKLIDDILNDVDEK